jgi:hypothetical protein
MLLGLTFQLVVQMKFTNHWMVPGVGTGAEAPIKTRTVKLS